MTEFEQQVGEALWARIQRWPEIAQREMDAAFSPKLHTLAGELGMQLGPAVRQACFDDLARGVAAAIEAAGNAGGVAEHTGLYGDKYKAEVQSDALAALKDAP